MQGQVTRLGQVTIPCKNLTIAPQLQCLREVYEHFVIWILRMRALLWGHAVDALVCFRLFSGSGSILKCWVLQIGYSLSLVSESSRHCTPPTTLESVSAFEGCVREWSVAREPWWNAPPIPEIRGYVDTSDSMCFVDIFSFTSHSSLFATTTRSAVGHIFGCLVHMLARLITKKLFK